MKKAYILSVILGICIASPAQNQFNSYIISNAGDTLHGEILKEINPGAGTVKFISETGRKKRYYPRQIKGFVINDTVRFVSILQTENAEAAEYHVFGKVVTEGPLNLLATQDKTGFLFGRKEEEQVLSYYLQDAKTDDIIKLPKLSFRKLLADQIAENGDLKREVLNKIYSYEEIPVVIENYNAWKSSGAN